ncbi:uncharacterized protein N7443_010312 [Penicillium atrosanguineum]|uniref:Uncharacterized protein n=1 Tax=Penicillium atrosanguineum TaxID=1132637 RepID=A0A9W9U1T0_9EURO|nr:uncharacterized protein N7443_010312 [Penicillium atrosanguineum]KAJ5290059.1 hypothetical protein N7443_010312 [Penicillium atrosanguineum]KAJ5307882.1 hypothetical protein N7476_008538 [Penicillium atrosanguineum]
MLTQRAGNGSWTPLARQLESCQPFNEHYNESKSTKTVMASTVTLLLDLAKSTDQKHLELLDGSGNTPVHVAVKKGFTHILKLMIDRRPDLLYHENATGSTPLEMAIDAWINNTTRNPPKEPLRTTTTTTTTTATATPGAQIGTPQP